MIFQPIVLEGCIPWQTPSCKRPANWCRCTDFSTTFAKAWQCILKLTWTILWRKTNIKATFAFFLVIATTDNNSQGFHSTRQTDQSAHQHGLLLPMPHIIEVFNAGENLLSQIDSPEIWTTFTSLFKMTWNSRNYVGWPRGVDIPFKAQLWLTSIFT